MPACGAEPKVRIGVRRSPRNGGILRVLERYCKQLRLDAGAVKLEPVAPVKAEPRPMRLRVAGPARNICNWNE